MKDEIKIPKGIEKIVKQVEAYKSKIENYSDDELKVTTEELRSDLKNGKNLDEILPYAYAVVREACKRVLGMEPYPVQIAGGVILHQGKIAEMKTGEGKTLVSVMPAYLNALEGKGVHVVTVNDYLAKRDAEWMGKVHEFLGLNVGVILHDMKPDMRRKAYAADITYVTNNEVGFDYLKDNMITKASDRVQRGLHYAIIDEVDSILIDEARTPLIISGHGGKATKLYLAADQLAMQMKKGTFRDYSKTDALAGESIPDDGDFVVDEKDNNIRITETGIRKIEEYFGLDNLASSEYTDIQHHIIMALRAHYLMAKDKDYVVKDGEILIVDEFTGRILPGRRYSDGLHQAIEAKEQIQVKTENKTLASITFQNLFNGYEKKCGMTGTAKTEEKEFKNIYHMKVVKVPTNKPVIRKDLEDLMFKTKEEKYEAVIDAIVEAHKTGQPVLVGTTTIEVSEHLSRLLTQKGISHNVLNAKLLEKEAEIVSKAGTYGAVTIATNMAGRGTDIKLDEAARNAGGLKVIGTERHESRRIDDQLRGRSGRQGDPGESQFYLSLDDKLMRLYAPEKMKKVFEAVGIEYKAPIGHKSLTKTIRKSQKRIEGNNYSQRKSVFDYDEVMNEQRRIIYKERDRIMDHENIHDSIEGLMDLFIRNLIEKKNSSLESIQSTLKELTGTDCTLDSKRKKDLSQFIRQVYQQKEAQLSDPEMMRNIEKEVLLKTIDRKWEVHIDDMDRLKQGIGLQAYGQKNPKIEYKLLAYKMFEDMTNKIIYDTLFSLFHIRTISVTC